MTLHAWPLAPCHPDHDHPITGTWLHYYPQGALVGDPCLCSQAFLGGDGEDDDS